MEDLHWIDPSTLEWLGLAIEQCPTASLLLLLTHRPQFEPPWPARGHVLALGLSRLSRSDSENLVACAIAEATLPEDTVAHIATRSDGIPLFVEELAKGVAEIGDTDEHDIPETLQDSLMARLDRLGDAKPVAQHAAAIGRAFEYALLEAVAPVRETELREGLGRLVEAELVYQRGLPPKATYTFKHALVQDTAYQSLLESQRKELHGRIADALESRFPERVAREPEVVARHCEEAGRTEQAIRHYQRAGERASQGFAREEAVTHLRRAIELLSSLPATRERSRREIDLQMALAAALVATRGYGHAEIERVSERVRALCEEIGDDTGLLRAVIWLSLGHYVRGQLSTALDLAKQGVALAEKVNGPFDRLVAHTRLGITLYFLGELRSALEHLEPAIRHRDAGEARAMMASWGQDWGTIGRTIAMLVLWTLGYSDRARRLIRESVDLARQGDPYSLAIALVSDAILHSVLGERDRAWACAEEAMEIARAGGFPTAMVVARQWWGCAVGGSRGLEALQTAVESGRAAGNVPNRTVMQSQLAEVYHELGRTDEALAALEVGFAISKETGTRFREAELERIRGEILWQQGALAEAEHCFRRALEIGREHEAKIFELRAATSLARLLREQDRSDEARTLLQPVYDWFTEGFDTQDLKDAKALLDELA